MFGQQLGVAVAETIIDQLKADCIPTIIPPKRCEDQMGHTLLLIRNLSRQRINEKHLLAQIQTTTIKSLKDLKYRIQIEYFKEQCARGAKVGIAS